MIWVFKCAGLALAGYASWRVIELFNAALAPVSELLAMAPV